MFGSTSKARSANSFATASLIETLEPRVLFSATSVSTVAELTTALADISVTTINVAAGTYELDQALKPQDGQSIIGAGEGQTIITGASSWDPGIVDFKDPGIVSSEFNPAPYLFSFDNNTDGVTISNLTLTGSQLHGGITAFNADDLTIHDVTFDDFLWSGVRTFNSDNAEIYDNTFIDAGGRIGNTISGSVYLTNFKDSVFYDNETTITEGSGREVMGFKGRNVENIRIHHNTFDTNDFAIELPFENDDNVEIDHNFIRGGAVSIPKANGGPTDLPNAYHIHHNYFNNAAAVEFPRNGVEINNNLFDFEATDQGGNLIFGTGAVGQGATEFHNNRIKNPGRGLVSIPSYDNFTFRNNHVIADASEGEFGGRSEGLIGFAQQTPVDFTINGSNTYDITVGDEQISVDALANVTITDPIGNDIPVSQSQYVTIDGSGVVTIINGVETVEIDTARVTIDGQLVDQGQGTYTHVTDFSTVVIKDNIFELNAGDRPLSKNVATYNAVVENNTFSGVEDAASFTNTDTGATRGVTTSFDFKVGANESFQIEDWTIYEVGGQGSFTGTPPVIDRTGSTRIQAQDYDRGGEDAAYFDTTGNNIGGEYRNDEVDIRTTADTGGVYKVGWTKSGEYLEYTIDTKAGNYDINLRLSSAQNNKDVEVFLDGASLGTVTVQKDGWENFNDHVLSNIAVADGQDRILRVEFLDGTTDFNWVEFTPVLPTVVLEAEDYTDKSLTSQSPQSQVTEDGFLQQNLGFIKKNNWTEYSGFDFGSNSYSDVTIRWSSNLTNGDGFVEIRTGSPTGALVGTATLGDTGGFTSYQEQSISLSTALTGTQDIYLVFGKATGGNPFLFNLDSLVFG